MKIEIAVVATAAVALAASAIALPMAAHASTQTPQNVRGTVSVDDPATIGEIVPVADDTPAGNIPAQVSPAADSTVGVGMPVSITFAKPVTDRQAVASGIRVSSSSGQRVVGHWFGSTRLDFRPEHYWKAGSDVTVSLRGAGLEGVRGVTGAQDESVRFHVGRSQVSTVDVRTKTMTVARDGKKVKAFPVSAGAPATPTYNGQMVISQKLRETRMDGATVGFANEDGTPAYDIPDVPHALRLSSSGTFAHGNYWAPKSDFGRVNSSHGCIGLNDVQGGNDPTTPAAWFYDHSLVGDVVVVKHSGDKTIAPDNGLSDWNLPWQAWVKDSAK